jgi:hypothetical protein
MCHGRNAVIKHVRFNKTGHNWFSWILEYRQKSPHLPVISRYQRCANVIFVTAPSPPSTTCFQLIRGKFLSLPGCCFSWIAITVALKHLRDKPFRVVFQHKLVKLSIL